MQDCLLLCKRYDYMVYHIDGDGLNNTMENLGKKLKDNGFENKE